MRDFSLLSCTSRSHNQGCCQVSLRPASAGEKRDWGTPPDPRKGAAAPLNPAFSRSCNSPEHDKELQKSAPGLQCIVYRIETLLLLILPGVLMTQTPFYVHPS